MAIVKRLTHLLTADIHAVLDLVEDPEALLKQAIRDMEEEIQRQQKSLILLTNKIESLNAQKKQLHNDETEVNRDIDLSFENKNNTLIRNLVKKKLIIQKHDSLVAKDIELSQQSLSNIQKQLAENQTQYETMCQQSEQLLKIASRSNDKHFNNYQSAFEISENDVELAILKEQQQRS
ncbi:PspA/IM30 family protein [Aliikangiella sp. IMCC44359]|uniref:PspA/IM30 family protein n=1 Tax=Aliikangiella sp. IMCC44359 TaxID=3459125 RepID=UPI00403A9363